ncbi:hypothetical protein F2Q69_00014594 [Brassica cretica]|uniref:Uncharacterized protein n=1 Tax=Brassica cretica TaxID=69181 RepID=A0A8S9QSW0_BRACR|nr:hypothetical protein F2Q69_00014594 [Brassica cretica]
MFFNFLHGIRAFKLLDFFYLADNKSVFLREDRAAQARQLLGEEVYGSTSPPVRHQEKSPKEKMARRL